MSYLEERVNKKMRTSPEEYTIPVNVLGRYGLPEVRQVPIFSSDAHDNIKILVYTLDRDLIYYEKERTRQTMSETDTDAVYYVTRMNPEWLAKNPEQPKYNFPKGVGIYPFFPPKLVEKYEKGEKIDMLVLTEGYFKAFVGSKFGIDIVGLSSITHYADSKTHQLHKDIRRLIDRCKVRTVIVLHDGDCRNISLKDLEREQELTRRPQGFLSALKNTREVLKDMVECIYFEHVNTSELMADENGEKPKGLDDLLLAPQYEDQTEDIVRDLTTLNRKSGDFFIKKDLKSQINSLQKYFHLDSEKSFYEAWVDVIKEKKFVFKGSIYRYDSYKRDLIREVPKELRNVYRVQDQYYEDVEVPTLADITVKEVKRIRRMKGALCDDFGREAVKNVPSYKCFINIPEHVNYARVIDNCLNLYYPLTHEPEIGNFPHINSLMRHIFGEQYELGMDYMQLLYQRPKQILPILCLVSTERGTGKTSFLDLLREMFGNNTVILGNSEIASEFNSQMAGKLIVGCDETALDDNSKITERLKMLATSKEIVINAKGQDQISMANFSKFVLCSNNELHFIHTDRDEVRFWVRKVPVLKRDEMIPNILPYLTDEINAFMFYLNNRKMSVPVALHRMWFAPEQIETDALRALQAAQRPGIIRDIETWLREYFLMFVVTEVEITVRQMRRFMDLSMKFSDSYIREVTKRYLHAETMGTGRTRVLYYPPNSEAAAYDSDNATRIKFTAEKIGGEDLVKEINNRTK